MNKLILLILLIGCQPEIENRQQKKGIGIHLEDEQDIVITGYERKENGI